VPGLRPGSCSHPALAWAGELGCVFEGGLKMKNDNTLPFPNRTPGPWSLQDEFNMINGELSISYISLRKVTEQWELACKQRDDLAEALNGLLANAPKPKNVNIDYHYMVHLEAARAALAKLED